ncbi:MAG: AAA family ATPase [Burkholderiales bacterium]|nr:AAA family ATPase [Burkholderiales bacterium]
MKLKSIHLQNFRLFKDFRCEFDERLTVLVANNGGGKTSILEAICIAFGPYLSAFPTGVGSGIEIGDVHMLIKDRNIGQIQRDFPAQILANGKLNQLTIGQKQVLADNEIQWFRSIASEKSGTTIKDAKVIAERGKELLKADSIEATTQKNIWPLLAFYGTGRLWRQTKLTSKKLHADAWEQRSAGYTDCLSAASSFKFVLEWLDYATRSNVAAFSRHLSNNPHLPVRFADFDGPFTPLLNCVQGAVNTVLKHTGWKNLYYAEALQDAILEHDDFGSIPVSQLSDGIRTTFGLVAEIAYRAVQLNPHLGENAALETDGIVMIDEVDMHLHPHWQQTILPDLLRAFPKVQFIVTTHSPQVLSTVKRENIRLISLEQGSIPLGMSYGEPSGNVLQSVMLVDPQPPVAERDSLRKLTELVDQGHYQDAQTSALLEELSISLGANHPQLQRLQRSIRRQELLKQVEPQK